MVLDANPLLVFFHKQPSWQFVERLLQNAVESDTMHLLSSINLGEIYYTLLRDYGASTAEDGLRRIKEGPIEIVIPSIEQTLVAGKFKAAGGISYADCFAGALALERDLPVLTGDEEFKRLIPFGVKVEWLPKNM